ncbi:MAG: class I SAM-dependent methyltransferase family protein [Desulfurococcaceae archaeon]
MTRGLLLKEIAKKSLGEDFATLVWRRVELIGDIAIIRAPFNLEACNLKPLAEELLKTLPYVKSVWAALPGVNGQYRLRSHIWLAGDHRSETLYKEHGCSFKVDINRVYLSPSLNYEHIRVARQVKQGEVVLNMFAGAGLFSIIIAKHAKPHKVYSIDISHDAYNYMVENIKLNRVEEIVVPLLGDAKDVIEFSLKSTSTRVLMPCPELSLQYLPHAIKSLCDQRGFIHVYLHIKASKGEHWRDKATSMITNKLHELSIDKFEVLYMRKIRNVGPRTHQVVVDLHIK